MINIERFEKIKKEIDNNLNKYEMNSYKSRVAKMNRFPFKVGLTFIISLLSYFGITILSANANVSYLMSIMSAETFSFAIIGISFCLGLIGSKMMTWRSKLKQKFREFSNVKTESEKLEKEVEYEIESRKIMNKNYGVEGAMNILNSIQSMFCSLSNPYNISDKSFFKAERQNKVKDFSI